MQFLLLPGQNYETMKALTTVKNAHAKPVERLQAEFTVMSHLVDGPEWVKDTD